MIRIELTNASNGILKRIVEIKNGSIDSTELLKVYEVSKSEPESLLDTMEILYEIAEDLGLDFGSDYGPAQVKLILDWGDRYSPTAEEIDLRLESLNSEIESLNSLKKTLDEENGNNI